MQNPKISVREVLTSDIKNIADYWLLSDDEHMIGMGVDLSKKPTREGLTDMLKNQISTALENKNSYALIWEIDGQAVGHCNVNDIKFGDHAFMHLHLWKNDQRRKGMGRLLLQKTLYIFFEKLSLQKIFCEPYALNPAPNKTLPKVGFEFVKTYLTVPGSFCSEQKVNRWVLTKDQFDNAERE